jgi:hypothetical protein
MDPNSLKGVETTATDLALAVAHVTENILLYLLKLGAADVVMLDRIQENALNNANLTSNSKKLVEIMLTGVRLSYETSRQAKA